MSGPDARVDAVIALLAQTEAAHGAYEATELNGVYDQDWPRWYAAYAIEHGFGDLVGSLITADQLGAFLATAWADFQRIEPRPAEGWAHYVARRATVELKRAP